MEVSQSYQLIVQSLLSSESAKTIRFYPDVIPYDDNQEQFYANWMHLFSKNPAYLYVDNFEVKPVSRFRYYLESLKGRLGFENHCDANRVTMMLAKYAYYGFANGFKNPILELNSKMILPKNLSLSQFESIKTIGLPQYKPTNIFKDAQLSLINLYQNMHQALQLSFWQNLFASPTAFINPKNNGFFFGDTLIQVVTCGMDVYKEASANCLCQLLSLKPQSYEFTYRYLDKITKLLRPEEASKCIEPNSFLAKTLAKKYMKIALDSVYTNSLFKIVSTVQGAMSKYLFGQQGEQVSTWESYSKAAKHLDLNLEQDYLGDFIRVEIQRKNYSAAARYIEKISDLQTKLKYLMQESEEFSRVLHKNSQTARELADCLIENNKQQSDARCFQKVQRLISPQVDPLFFIENYVKKNLIERAVKIYEKYHPDIPAAAAYKDALAKYFSIEGERLYEHGKKLNPAGENMQKYYRDSLHNKKKALVFAQNDQEYIQDVNIHRRLLAQSIFRHNAKTKDQRINDLEKIINKYQKCFDQYAMKYDEDLIPNYLKALEERISIALSNCLDPTSFVEGDNATQEHKELCKDDIQIATKYLELAISLVNKNQDSILWAKLQFMLGDLKRYFEIEGCIEHLKYAAEANPNNPFYKASFGQMGGDKQTIDAAWEQFATLNIDPNIYFKWKSERWNGEKIFTKELGDIHTYNTKEDSFLPSFIRKMM